MEIIIQDMRWRIQIFPNTVSVSAAEKVSNVGDLHILHGNHGALAYSDFSIRIKCNLLHLFITLGGMFTG